jgi:hypothetical protein
MHDGYRAVQRYGTGEPAHGELIALGTATTLNGSCEVALPSEVTQHRTPIDGHQLLMSSIIYTSKPFKAVHLPKNKAEAARLSAYPRLDHLVESSTLSKTNHAQARNCIGVAPNLWGPCCWCVLAFSTFHFWWLF